MKIVLEKEEWQLLGQLAIEAGAGTFRKSLLLAATLLWEFYQENAQGFQQPQRRKRNLRYSTAIGIYHYVSAEELREDSLWDATLVQLKSKLYKLLMQSNKLEHETPY